MQIAIVGLGQSLRGDDAAGLEAIRFWEQAYPATASRPGIRVEYAGTAGLTLLSLLEEVEVAVLVDAVQSGAAPGTVHTLKEGDIPVFLAGSGSAHGWGLAETLALGRQAGAALPGQIILVGIEIGQVNVGAGLSAGVQVALAQAAQEIEKAVQNLLLQAGDE